MRTLRVILGSFAVAGLAAGTFHRLSSMMSDPNQTQWIWANAPKIALAALLTWLVVGWLATDAPIASTVIAVLEGAVTYVIVRALFSQARLEHYLNAEYPRTATPYDPSTMVVFFMISTFLAVGIGAFFVYGFADDRKLR
jgi:hypothetical protein